MPSRGWRAEGALSELPARSQERSAKAAGLGRPAAPCGGTAGRARGEEDQGAERGLDRLWQRGAVARRTRVTAGRHKPRSAGWLGGGDGWGRLPASGGGAGPAEAESRRAQGAREAGGPPRPCPCAGGCWCRRLGTSGAGPPAERANKLFPVGARLSARGPADTASLQSCPRAPREPMPSGRLTLRGRHGSPPLPERREVQKEPRARPRAASALPDHPRRQELSQGRFLRWGHAQLLGPVGHADPSPVDTVLPLHAHLGHVVLQTLGHLVLPDSAGALPGATGRTEGLLDTPSAPPVTERQAAVQQTMATTAGQGFAQAHG